MSLCLANKSKTNKYKKGNMFVSEYFGRMKFLGDEIAAVGLP
jgi:hypothetical protein